MSTATPTRISVPVYWCSRAQDAYAADSAHITNERVCSARHHFTLYYEAPKHVHDLVAQINPGSRVGQYDVRVSCDDCVDATVFNNSGSWAECVAWASEQLAAGA